MTAWSMPLRERFMRKVRYAGSFGWRFVDSELAEYLP